MNQGSKIAISGLILLLLGFGIFIIGLALPTDAEMRRYQYNKAARNRRKQSP